MLGSEPVAPLGVRHVVRDWRGEPAMAGARNFVLVDSDTLRDPDFKRWLSEASAAIDVLDVPSNLYLVVPEQRELTALREVLGAAEAGVELMVVRTIFDRDADEELIFNALAEQGYAAEVEEESAQDSLEGAEPESDPGAAPHASLEPYLRPHLRLSDAGYAAWLDRLKADPSERGD